MKRKKKKKKKEREGATPLPVTTQVNNMQKTLYKTPSEYRTLNKTPIHRTAYPPPLSLILLRDPLQTRSMNHTQVVPIRSPPPRPLKKSFDRCLFLQYATHILYVVRTNQTVVFRMLFA